MSEFFEQQPPPPSAADFRPPEWSGPPENEMGVPVPLEVELARTDDVAIAILGLVAASTGFSFTCSVRNRHRRNNFGPLHPGVPLGGMRFGIEFSDGRKATTVKPHRPRHPQDPPEQPLLMMRGGGGGRRFEANFWVWPLPPPGPVAFVCDWQEHGIELTRREIDAQAILDAAAKVEQLWLDERPEPQGPWTIAGG